MTQAQATKDFRAIYSSEMAQKPIDKPLINLLWQSYLDSLLRDGSITSKQAKRWLDPIQQKTSN